MYPLRGDETPPKKPVKSTVSKADFGHRALPLNVLGGHRWPARSIDRDLVAEIIATELPERRNPISDSGNPYLDQIPDDLSIPAFLRRSA